MRRGLVIVTDHVVMQKMIHTAHHVAKWKYCYNPEVGYFRTGARSGAGYVATITVNGLYKFTYALQNFLFSTALNKLFHTTFLTYAYTTITKGADVH